MQRLLDGHKLIRVAVVVLAIGLFSYLIGYFASMNSDAFSEAQRFIVQSPTANNELGGSIEVQLSPFGYELEFAGSWGAATFDCNVRGLNGKGKAQINLSKAGDIWRVKKATLYVNGRVVELQ